MLQTLRGEGLSRDQMVWVMMEQMGKQAAGEKQGRKPWTLREIGGKTLWDWLQLLIVPVVLSLITVVFAWQQDTRQGRLEDQRAKAERELAVQRAQDEALQAYLDQMSGLLLEKDLRTSEVNSEVRTLAQVRTLTVLGRLDPGRKTAVMQFLIDADLVQSIDERDPIISLNGADLSGANVSDANLRNADLNGADLRDANLRDSDLSFADLSDSDSANADLSFADLSDSDLRGASLSDVDLRGAILRDAILSVAILRGADLSNAYLRGADLSDSDLSDSDLSNAYLRGADLSNTYLRGADLSDVFLRGADLSDVNPRDLRGTMVDGGADEAILTVRQCSEADASLGPHEERIYEIIPQMPEEIRLGETERAGLLVAPLTIDAVSESDTGCVVLADRRMQAQLVPYDRGIWVISGQHPDIQELSSNRVTRWGWDITARQTGKLQLLIDLRYAISRKDQELFRLVPQSPVYDGAIRVTTEQPSP